MERINSLIEQIKNIDTESLDDIVDGTPSVNIIEKQRTYFWSRLYLKDEFHNMKIGDKVIITDKRSGEKLEILFVGYGKSKQNLDFQNEIREYSDEVDKKILIFMVDEDVINYSKEIPYIRTLFKLGRYYEENLIRRSDLNFILEDSFITLNYYDFDF